MNTLLRISLPIACALATSGCPGNVAKPSVGADLFAGTDVEPPGLNELAVICPGERAILTWGTSNASSAVIEPDLGSVALSGSEAVAPAVTTIYQLVASGDGGEASDGAGVKVIDANDNQVTKTLTEPPVDPDTGYPTSLIWSGTISPQLMTARAYVTHVKITAAPSDWPYWEFRHTSLNGAVSSFNVDAQQGATAVSSSFPAIGSWEATPYFPTEVTITSAKGSLGLEITLVCRN